MLADGERPLRAFLEPIADVLSDSAVTEVVVNRPGELGIERQGVWSWRDVPEFTFERLDQIAILAAYATGRDVDEENPFCGSTLPDGQRIHIARPGATARNVIALCIRRPSDVSPTFDDEDFPALFSDVNAPVSKSRQYDDQLRYLLEQKDLVTFFKMARKARKTIDVCGPTGQGKTHFLKRIMNATEASMRTLTIESDVEFGASGPKNRVSFFYNEQHPKLQPVMAVQAALRFKPDEIFFQETKGEEAWAVMRARAGGHKGGGTSWHADEGKEIEALMLMMRQYPPVAALPDDRLRAICLMYIDIIVWCDKDPDAGFKVPRVWMKGAGS